MHQFPNPAEFLFYVFSNNLYFSARSPLVGHINSSLEGLTTIRAFGAQQILKNEFDRHQDLYTSALMTKKISIHGFGFVIEIFSTIFSLCIISWFLFFETSE